VAYEVDVTNFPELFKQTYAAMSPEAKDRWKADRLKALSDPIFLGDELLGMDFVEEPHRLLFEQFLKMRPETGLVLSDLDLETKKRMILWSRGIFKTSAVIVVMTQLILNYPNIRLCFLTGQDLLSKRQLARVKRVFEKPSKKFAGLFPEFCGIKTVFNKKENKWVETKMKLGNAHEFTVPCRTSDTFAEPTFAISTAKSVKAGSHFDCIFIDDLVNEQNYKSVKALDKCYQDYIDMCPLLEPTGYIVMTGTRYSFGDTYERIQEMAKQEEKDLGRTIWKFSVRDCWSLGCRHCPHSDVYHDKTFVVENPCHKCDCRGFEPNGIKGVLFPAVRTKDGRAIGHTIEFLEGERIRLGAEFFANQYENSPMAQGSQTFTSQLIDAQTLHHLVQIPSYGVSYTFAVGDLAYVGQADRDFSVIYICRLFQGQIFVFDCVFGNWDSGAVAENVISVLLQHRPNIVYLEQFNGWEAYNTIITAHANTRGIQKVPVVWEKCSHAANAKLIRIGAIQGVLKNKRIWLYAAMRGFDQLVQQLLKWPKLGRHDDFADCLGQVVSAPTGYQLENPPQVVSATNWLRRYNESPADSDQYGDSGCGNGIICG